MAKVRAAEAVRLARGGAALTVAVREAGTTVVTVRRNFPRVVRRRGRRLTVTKSDQVTFTMRVASINGTVHVNVEGSAQRSIVGAHWNAIDQYLATGDTEPLDEFVGVTVSGVALQTDQEQLLADWRAGQFDHLEIYQPNL